MRTHERVFELLPWYVNGSLDEADMVLVEDHLPACALCTAEVTREMNVARLVQPGKRDEAVLESLMARQASAYPGLRERIRPARVRQRRYAAVAVLVVSVVLVGVLGGPWNGTAQQRTVYETMTQPAPDAAGVYVQIAFGPATAESDIRRVLLEGGASLVGNPSEAGVYRLVVADPTRVADVVGYLERQAAVRWIEVER